MNKFKNKSIKNALIIALFFTVAIFSFFFGSSQIALAEETDVADVVPTTSSSRIYANGTPILVMDAVDVEDYTTIKYGYIGEDYSQENLTNPDNYETEYLTYANTSNYDIYGGSGDSSVGDITGDTYITVIGGDIYYLYGGGYYYSVDGNTNLLVEDGVIDYIYAGSVGTSSAYVSVSGDTNLVIKNGTFKYIYGGGSYCDIDGDTHVTIDSGSMTAAYGGGSRGTISNTYITIGTLDGESQPVIASYLCGGGNYGDITGNTNLVINGGTIGSSSTSSSNGSNLIIGGGLHDTVYGYANVTYNGGTYNVYRNYAGGADGITGAYSYDSTVISGVNVKVTGGTFPKTVLIGAVGDDAQNTYIVQPESDISFTGSIGYSTLPVTEYIPSEEYTITSSYSMTYASTAPIMAYSVADVEMEIEPSNSSCVIYSAIDEDTGLRNYYIAYDISKYTITVANQTYTGSAIEPAVSTYLSSSSYTLSYEDNIDAGTAKVIVTGVGLYGGTKTLNFTISPIDVTTSQDVTVSTEKTSSTYDGTDQTPTISVKYGENDIDEKNYTIEWSLNDVVVDDVVDAGEYQATITFKNNYTGTKTLSYEIVDEIYPEIQDKTETAYGEWYGNQTLSFDITDNSGYVSVLVTVNGEELISIENNDDTSDYITAIEKGVNFEYNFNQTGSYVVKIAVTDIGGKETETTATIYIESTIDTFIEKFEALSQSSTATDYLALIEYYSGLTANQQKRIYLEDSSSAVASANSTSQSYYIQLLEYIEEEAKAILEGKILSIETAISDAVSSPSAESIEKAQTIYASYLAEEDVISALSDEAVASYQDLLAVSAVVEYYQATAPSNYTRLNIVVLAYENLSETQKNIANAYTSIDIETLYASYAEDKSAVDDFTTAVSGVSSITEELETVKDLLGYIYIDEDGATQTFDSNLESMLGLAVTETLEEWQALIVKIETVQTAIDNIVVLSDDESNYEEFVASLLNVENAYEALSSSEQSLIDTTALENAQEDLAEKIASDANEAFAIAFQKLVATLSYDSSTIEDVIAIEEAYEKLSEEVQALTTTISAKTTLDAFCEVVDSVYETDETEEAKIVNKLESIKIDGTTLYSCDTLTEVQTEYQGLDTNAKSMVYNSYSSTITAIDSILARLSDAETAIETLVALESSGCELDEYFGEEHDEEHDLDEHITAIETAKMEIEKLSSAEKALLSDVQIDGVTYTAVEYVNAEYDKLVEYLAYMDTVIKSASAVDGAEEKTVTVYGLATKVDTTSVTDVGTGSTLTILVSAEETESEIADLSASQEKLIAYDIKLLAYVDDNEPEAIQPTNGETVLVTIPIGKYVISDAMKIYHVKEDGTRTVVDNVVYFMEGDMLYASYSIDSFSDFIVTGAVTAEEQQSSSSSSGSSNIVLNLNFSSDTQEEVETEEDMAQEDETPSETVAPQQDVEESYGADVQGSEESSNGLVFVWIILAVAIVVGGYIIYKKKTSQK